MRKKLSIISLIPARGGSKGITHKNLRTLGEFPLIAFSIAASRKSRLITRTIVSTDSEEIARVARTFAAELPFMRPRRYARDTSTDSEVFEHLLCWLKRHENSVPDIIVHLRPTTPLRDPSIVDRAIRELINNREASSLRSAHRASESVFKWFSIGKNGYFKSLFPGYTNDDLNNPRQTFPDVFEPNGYVDVIRTREFLKTGQLHGSRMLAFETPRCTEVDTLEDLERLQFELGRKRQPLLEFLKRDFIRRQR